MTWTINNKEVKSLTMNNKEIISIVRTSDNAILYQKPSVENVTLTVTKIWNDNNNKQLLRPVQLRCTLQPTQDVIILNDANNWTYTINVPKYINNVEVNYTWREQEVLGYTLENTVISNNTTIFTNKVTIRPDTPSGPETPR